MAVASRRADADVVELGYAVLVASQVTKLADMTPRQRTAVEYALGQFFDAQDPDNGSWPRSQPLFHYKKWGTAYCYDYEFLVQLLAEEQLQGMLVGRLKNLRLAGNEARGVDDPARRFKRRNRLGHGPPQADSRETRIVVDSVGVPLRLPARGPSSPKPSGSASSIGWESATCSRSCRKGKSSSTRSDSSTATSRSSTAPRCR